MLIVIVLDNVGIVQTAQTNFKVGLLSERAPAFKPA